MKNYGYNSFSVSSANTSSSGGGGILFILKILLGAAVLIFIGWIAINFFFPKKKKVHTQEELDRIARM